MTWKSNMKTKSQFIYLKNVLYFYRVTQKCLIKYILKHAIYEKYLIRAKKPNNVLYTYVKQLLHLDLYVSQFSVKKMSESRVFSGVTSVFHQTRKRENILMKTVACWGKELTFETTIERNSLPNAFMHFKHYSIIQVCLLYLACLIVLDIKFKASTAKKVV